jgi:hypothetical protein
MPSPDTPPASRFFSKADFALYLALALAAFGRCLFLGLAYFDNDLLAQFGPWRIFLRDQLAQGHFPLWNPYNLGGQPFFADLQNMMLYPFNWLTLVFPVAYGLGVFFFIHMFWAALGMHLWLRLLGLSEGSSRAGALLFALSNFYWLELIHPPVIAAFAWLPWLFAGLEALSRSPKPLPAFFSGLTFAMLFLCGSIQVSVGAFYGGLAYFLFRAWVNRGAWKPETTTIPPPRLQDTKKSLDIETIKDKTEILRKLKPYLLVGLLLVWGALPLLGQFIPTQEFSSRCVRGASMPTYEQFNAKLPLNPATLYQFLFPRFTLEEGRSMTEAVQFGNTDTRMAANLGYLGAWLPFLVFAGLSARDRKTARFLLVFMILALVICFGRYTPFHRMVCAALPGFSLIQVPYRFLFLYVLSASALAAFGLEALISCAAKSRLKTALWYAALLYFVALFRWDQNWREILGLSLGVAAFFLWNAGNSGNKIRLVVLQTALAAPLLLNGWWNFTPAPASNYDFAENSKPFLQAVKKAEPFRVMFFNSEMGYPIRLSGREYILNYPQNAACALGIKNFGGYNPLMLQAKKEIAPLPLASLLQVGGIRGILRGKNQDMPGFKREVLGHYCFYEYQGPLSYAFAPARWQTAPDPAQALSLMLKPGFDAAKEAVLCEPLPAGMPAASQPAVPVHLQYQMEQDEPDYQRFSVELNRENLVIFAEVMFPGWKVFVDGRPVPLLAADYLLRGLFMDAGKHRVEFRFEPSWWRPILIGLAFWIFLTLLGFVFFKFHRKGFSRA